MALSSRERTIAIAAGAVLGIGALYSVLLAPLQTRLDAANAQIEQRDADVDRADQLLERRTRAARLWREMTGTTLKSDQQSADGQLGDRVRNVAASAGLTLDSVKQDRSEREKYFNRLAIRVTANGTMSQVKRFLDALRTTDIPLRVTDLTLASRRDGMDDVSLQIGIATIYAPPPPAATPAGREVTR